MRHIHLHHLNFHAPFGSLLPHQLSRSAKELFLSVGILGFAVSAATLFEPIYLFTLHYSLSEIVLFSIITYGLYFLLIPLGAKFAARYGFERAILLGSSLLIVYYLALFGIAERPWLFFVAPVFSALQKMFYWVGYHGDFARSATSGEVGREIGELNMIIGLVTILGPIAGGALAATVGFPVLFVIVAALILLSNVPLLTHPVQHVREHFSYRSAFARLLSPKEQHTVLTGLGYGEEFTFLVMWPIFIFLAVQGVVAVGVIVTFAALLTSFLLLYIGKLVDARGKHLMRVGVAMKVGSWLGRLFAVTGWHVFFIDAFYRLALGTTDYPLMREVYTRSKNTDTIGTIVLFEMALILGKLLMMAALLAVFTFIGISWTAVFLLASLFSFFYLALTVGRSGHAAKPR